ncbi:MAG TPA: retropepsin-like aspartic protease, partial [Steroidobacteraceae bacterium]|nr:retropepsin-like aspartic protease [Steroidobacteraceae bacterium]
MHGGGVPGCLCALLLAAAPGFAPADPARPAPPVAAAGIAPRTFPDSGLIIPGPAAPADAAVPEVKVEAPEPRYVAPTLRDRLGRIWAPVYINGKGPFRLVLDTGANHSAIIAPVALQLGLMPEFVPVMLHGVTGSAMVAAVHVDSLIVGDLQLTARTLPIVPDALGGADGVLGTEGLFDKRIFIDFMHDRITITRSHHVSAGFGFETIPVQLSPNGLLTTMARMGGIKVKVIIDTGGQATVANLALRDALLHRHGRHVFTDESVTGATDDVQVGQGTPVPPIQLGPILINGARVTLGDLRIFEVWHMTDQPAMLVGIDTLGLLDTLIID